MLIDNKNRAKCMLIEKHISWIALNNVVGCPNNCAYCFLKQKKTKPMRKETPFNTLQKLIKSKHYTKDIPIALMVNTDIFSTPQNMDECLEILNTAHSMRLPNLFCLVTKRLIPEDVARKLSILIKQGVKILVYISYSGLPPEFEKGTWHNGVADSIISMKILKKVGVPCAHYWRPLLPQNTSPKKLVEVYETVKDYCIGSVISGLKLYPCMETPYWPEAKEAFLKNPNCESIYPKGTLKMIKSIVKDYPIFVDNFCLLAIAQKKACEYDIFNSGRCNEYSNCPYKKLKKNPCKTVTKTLKKTCCKNYWGNSLTSAKWIEI